MEIFKQVFFQAIITGGSEGHVKCKIPVTPELLNGIGTLHGGAVATMVDSVSTWALVSVGKNVPGVSVDLSISYVHTLQFTSELGCHITSFTIS